MFSYLGKGFETLPGSAGVGRVAKRDPLAEGQEGLKICPGPWPTGPVICALPRASIPAPALPRQTFETLTGHWVKVGWQKARHRQRARKESKSVLVPGPQAL